MSGNKKKDNEGGFGLGAAFLVAAGAGAVGFLARDLWNSYQEFQSQPSSSGGRRPPPPPFFTGSNSSSWENTSDKKVGSRKKQREAFKDQNVPDEMKCVVCLDNPREICLVPCGHVCLCEDCADKIDSKCPLCQQNITNKKIIYL